MNGRKTRLDHNIEPLLTLPLTLPIPNKVEKP